jgi:AcrR family transcriptional regulator
MPPYGAVWSSVRYRTDVPRNQTLDRSAWVEGGYRQFTAGGLDAVRVEPLARELGATKGSFYWHFADRAELLVAVLDRWAAATEEIIEAAVASSPDAEGRLRSIVGTVAEQSGAGRGEALLYGQTANPVIAEVVDRVTARRLGVVADLLREKGFSAAQARARAGLALAAALGHQQLALAGTPATKAPPRDRRLVADLVVRTLLN